MKWIDHASDVAARVEEQRKTDPSFEEACEEGVNWRSEDFAYRVTVTDTKAHKEHRTWSLWDMRSMPAPWGPLQGTAKGVPVPLLTDIGTLKAALILGELASRGRAVRLALGAWAIARVGWAQSKQMLAREKAL
jgi:hypothetical protein